MFIILLDRPRCVVFPPCGFVYSSMLNTHRIPLNPDFYSVLAICFKEATFENLKPSRNVVIRASVYNFNASDAKLSTFS